MLLYVHEILNPTRPLNILKKKEYTRMLNKPVQSFRLDLKLRHPLNVRWIPSHRRQASAHITRRHSTSTPVPCSAASANSDAWDAEVRVRTQQHILIPPRRRNSCATGTATVGGSWT